MNTLKKRKNPLSPVHLLFLPGPQTYERKCSFKQKIDQLKQNDLSYELSDELSGDHANVSSLRSLQQ
jgi:hypothetical protein